MQSTINITLPEDQLEGTVAKVSRWLVEVGASVSEGQPILELETDKVMMEVSAPATGVLQAVHMQPGDEVELETVVGTLAVGNVQIEVNASTPVEDSAGSSSAGSVSESTDNSRRHLVGPAVRRLLLEHRLVLDDIPGTGKGGRVTRDDVMRYIRDNKVAARPQNTQPLSRDQKSTTPAAPGKLVGVEHPHTPMRQAIAKHMVDSLLKISPHVTSVFEMDMSNVIEHRRWHKKEYAEAGVKLTFTAYFLAATVKAMRAVPQMNARYHEHALEIFDDINIGVGTALGDDGLVVPVVQHVQEKTLFDVAKALQHQTEKARNGKLKPSDMANGTFTISNHGVSGSLFAAPIIINQPQVAILGVGKLEKRVVVREVNGEDEIQIKPLSYVSLSIDHRAVDAHQTNKFLSVFVETIENWGQ